MILRRSDGRRSIALRQHRLSEQALDLGTNETILDPSAGLFSSQSLARRSHRAVFRKEAQDWRVYNGGPENIHYSKLAQINRENVSRLQVAWTFDAGDSFSRF